MEEGVLIFVIPALFLLICVTSMFLNHWYYKAKSPLNEGKLTAKVSVINISNMAGATPPSPTQKRKGRHTHSKSKSRDSRSRSKSKSPSRLEVPRIGDHYWSSAVISLNDTDCPPSYQSLFEYDSSSSSLPQCQSEVKGQGQAGESKSKSTTSSTWLHPDSARNVKANESPFAVLYL